MEKQFKLVMVDHDGTLVNDDRVLSERTKQVLEKLHQEGYLIGMASGRSVKNLSKYPANWGLSFNFDVIIGFGGGQVRDNIHNKDYQYNLLSPETIKEIILSMRMFNVPASVITLDEFSITEDINDLWKESMKRNSNPRRVKVVKEDDELWQNPQPKILYRDTIEKIDEMEAYVRKHPKEGYWGFRTQPNVFEFQDVNNTKYRGLKKVCELLGISLNEVIAFGDTTNDNDMLECCYGVCMKNGSPDTKAVAKEVTRYTNNEDGFADYVEQHLL